MQGAPTWQYKPVVKSLVHQNSQLCLAVRLGNLLAEKCAMHDPAQKWSFSGALNA